MARVSAMTHFYDEYDPHDFRDPHDRFRDPGGRSALRRGTRRYPRVARRSV
jgi:hypothetical protein